VTKVTDKGSHPHFHYFYNQEKHFLLVLMSHPFRCGLAAGVFVFFVFSCLSIYLYFDLLFKIVFSVYLFSFCFTCLSFVLWFKDVLSVYLSVLFLIFV
jgi:hypothetical protein